MYCQAENCYWVAFGQVRAGKHSERLPEGDRFVILFFEAKKI